MMEDFERLYTKKDFHRIAEDKVISLQFITNYLSFDRENFNTATTINKYLYRVNEKLVWDLLFLLMPKKERFIWNRSYIGRGKKQEVTDFDKKVKKFTGWSSREYSDMKDLIELIPDLKEKFAKRLALSNKERKECGLEIIENPTVEKLRKGTADQLGMNQWMS